jgi:hypothetical protein
MNMKLIAESRSGHALVEDGLLILFIILCLVKLWRS